MRNDSKSNKNTNCSKSCTHGVDVTRLFWNLESKGFSLRVQKTNVDVNILALRLPNTKEMIHHMILPMALSKLNTFLKNSFECIFKPKFKAFLFSIMYCVAL